MITCNRCGGTNVQVVEWTYPNRGVIVNGDPFYDGGEELHTWCDDCHAHCGAGTDDNGETAPTVGDAVARASQALWTSINGADVAQTTQQGRVLETVASFLSCLAEDIQTGNGETAPGTIGALIDGLRRNVPEKIGFTVIPEGVSVDCCLCGDWSVVEIDGRPYCASCGTFGKRCQEIEASPLVGDKVPLRDSEWNCDAWHTTQDNVYLCDGENDFWALVEHELCSNLYENVVTGTLAGCLDYLARCQEIEASPLVGDKQGDEWATVLPGVYLHATGRGLWALVESDGERLCENPLWKVLYHLGSMAAIKALSLVPKVAFCVDTKSN